MLEPLSRFSVLRSLPVEALVGEYLVAYHDYLLIS